MRKTNKQNGRIKHESRARDEERLSKREGERERERRKEKRSLRTCLWTMIKGQRFQLSYFFGAGIKYLKHL